MKETILRMKFATWNFAPNGLPGVSGRRAQQPADRVLGQDQGVAVRRTICSVAKVSRMKWTLAIFRIVLRNQSGLNGLNGQGT